MATKGDYGITILHQPTPNSATTASETAGGEHASEYKAKFDLVAVHGLNGDAIKTWTHEQNGVMWLRDLLPEVLPDARILTFGYNSRFKSFTAHQDLRTISSKLLAELSDVRATKEEKSRPIILVCHSLGGIVAKKALLIGCPEDHESVQQSIYGILFLGTPHNGSSIASLAKLVANIVSVCSSVAPARAMIGALRKDSEVLLDITEDFVKRRKNLQLISFFELEMTHVAPFLKKMIVEHRSAVLNLPEETTIGQYSNHRDIARFESLQDRNFRSVLSRLKKLSESIDEQFYAKTHHSSGTPLSTDSAIPLDIPILPCLSFHGRVDILNKMENYFFTENNSINSRRTFAICGLGGSGKTQIALHFLFRNLSTYKTGVMFLNAMSVTSLNTEFARIHDLLNLGDANDKVTSVKRWLSRKENSNWLMVLDNADDLRSVPLSKYFPVASWGHIAITSRDQTILGSLTEEGCSLGPLDPADAMSVLIEKADIIEPSTGDLQSAEEIVKLLGSLPLAVCQAGAFIRSRHKSLQDYLDLYLKQRHSVLQLRANLADSERTVLTTWEINFQQIEEESKDAASLLLLFCFLDPSTIPETVLHRGSSSQKRWVRNGEVVEVPADAEGLDRNLMNLIQNELQFDAAIEKLLSFSLIACNHETQDLRSFWIHPLVQFCAVQRLPTSTADYWRQQATLLICHAFPRSAYFEPLIYDLGKLLLPHLARVLCECDILSTEPQDHMPFRHALATTLLAASRFSNTKWKRETITRVKTILHDDPDPDLNAWLTYRQSAVLRMEGREQDSRNCLLDFVQSTILPGHDQGLETGSKYNAQRCELITAFSGNLIRHGKLEEAKHELQEWTPLDPSAPSSLETIASMARDTILGKLLRYQGHFEKASLLLEQVLADSVSNDYFEGSGWYRILLSNLADSYCEVDRAQEAEKLLEQELKRMDVIGTRDIPSGRQLQISLAETYLARDMFPEAEDVLLHLKDAYDSNTLTPTYSADISTFRVWVGLARIAHLRSSWDEALSYWNQALSTAERVKIDEDTSVDVVRYSMAHALSMTGERTKSDEMLKKAKTNMSSKNGMFWIARFDSQWHDYIVRVSNLENLGVWDWLFSATEVLRRFVLPFWTY